MLVMILSRIMFLAVWKFRTLANHHSASTQPLVPSRHERFTVVNRVVNRGPNETTKRFTMFISEMNSQKFGENFLNSVKYQATIRLPTTSHRTLPEISLTFSTFLRFFISSYFFKSKVLGSNLTFLTFFLTFSGERPFSKDFQAQVDLLRIFFKISNEGLDLVQAF